MHVDIKQDKTNNSVECSTCKSSTCNESDNIHITAPQSTLEHTLHYIWHVLGIMIDDKSKCARDHKR